MAFLARAMKRRLHSCYLFQAALLCVFGFPDTRAQIPCYLRLDAMRWLLKTALPAAFFVRRDRKSSTRFRCSGRKTGIFDAETGSHLTAHTTIQSPPNRRNCPCSERGRSSRDFRRHYSVLSVSGETSGLTGLLQAPVSAFKNSVPGGAIPPANTLGVRGNIGVLGSGRKRHAVTYLGFSPRASNCWCHSAGASRSRSTPRPRGKRPSTAALTRSGARNASEIVILTWRTLHF